MTNVLFVCLHNAGRSQMSHALFEQAVNGQHHARSAGTQPADHINPVVIDSMRELGIDIADRTPHRLSDDDARWADIVVTMGCGDSCPSSPAAAPSTETSPTRPANQSTKSARSATTLLTESTRSPTNSGKPQ
jgi:protein-tyrosine-phosphatase